MGVEAVLEVGMVRLLLRPRPRWLHHRRLLQLLCGCADPGHLRRPFERSLGPPERPPDHPLQEGHRLVVFRSLDTQFRVIIQPFFGLLYFKFLSIIYVYVGESEGEVLGFEVLKLPEKLRNTLKGQK